MKILYENERRWKKKIFFFFEGGKKFIAWSDIFVSVFCFDVDDRLSGVEASKEGIKAKSILMTQSAWSHKKFNK